jgi:hypothetical protein
MSTPTPGVYNRTNEEWKKVINGELTEMDREL